MSKLTAIVTKKEAEAHARRAFAKGVWMGTFMVWIGMAFVMTLQFLGLL